MSRENSLSLNIRLLEPKDAGAYVSLRREALLDAPLAFAASPADDFAASVDTVRDQLRRGHDWVIFGAFADRLVGTVGAFRDRHLKCSHRLNVWGMYVDPQHRRRGIGNELLGAVLRHAKTLSGVAWIYISVSSAAPQARRLYERVGFQLWGTTPDALRHEGQSAVEYHLAFSLR